MKKILAVSGGIDSVVMLDLVLKGLNRQRSNNRIYHEVNNSKMIYSSDEIIVAHFDHGIRTNSRDDAEFVKRLAEERGLKFITRRAELGEQASEAQAREARYEFLREVAGLDGVIYVAHHLDDLVETVAINFLRGTGWRGLTGMNQSGVRRPLLEAEVVFEPMDKQAVFEYAAKRGLHYREDPTNSSDEYLRNRIRHLTKELAYDIKLEIYQLWKSQREIGREIDQLVTSLIPGHDQLWQRSWFRDLEERGGGGNGQVDMQKQDESGIDEQKIWNLVALEMLRAGTLRAGVKATRPQLEEFRQAILNYAPGKKFNLPGDRLIKILKEGFIL